jgi:hypothetical protein
MRVQVAYAAPGIEALVELELAPGAVVADALRLSGLPTRLGLDPAALSWAIHGQRATLETPLRDGDRVEVLRPLVADPKAARRRRAAEHPLPRPAPRVKRRTKVR